MQRVIDTERFTVKKFGGLDLGGSAGEGRFSSMMNMTGERYPVLSTREGRGEINFGDLKVFGIASLDVLINGEIVRNAFIADCQNYLKAFYSGAAGFTGTTLSYTSSMFEQGRHRMVECGGYLYFFPSNKYINLMNPNDRGSLEEIRNIACGVSAADSERFIEATAVACDAEGNAVSGQSEHILLLKKVYAASSGVKGSYLLNMPYSTGFSALDTVEVSGFLNGELNGEYSVEAVTQTGALVLGGSISAEYAQSTGTVTVARRVPEMDYVISCGNRLWGCRYGVNDMGKPINEIYASALGDAKNWRKYLGVSTDSYTASVGRGGSFTGAVCFGGRPYFFKEDCIIKVYGDYPSEFSLIFSDVRGVELGSAESIAVVNDVLYYKTYSGIVRYDGGVPVNVDAALGNNRYTECRAGSSKGRYFASMKDEDGKRRLFVYDSVRGMWHEEEDPGVVQFCRCAGELYMLCEDESGASRVLSVGGTCNADSESAGCPEGDFHWECVSGALGYESEDEKLLTSLTLRMELPLGSRASVSLEYDGEGGFIPQTELSGWGRRRCDIRIRPRRCDCFRLKLSGVGEAKIYSLTRESEKCTR